MNKTGAKPIKINRKNTNINVADILICVSFLMEIILLIGLLFITDTLGFEILLFINIYFLFFSVILNLFIMGINKHFPIFVFYCCFFVFLLGRKFIQCFNNDIVTVYNSFSTKFVQAILHGTDYVIFSSLLYLSVFITFLVYKVFYRYKSRNNTKTQESQIKIRQNKRKVCAIRKISQIMSWITLIFALAEKIIILRATSNLSYVESYQTNVDVPILIKMFNAMFDGSVFVFLATKPKKSAMWPILISYFIVNGVLSSINGNRAQLGTCLLLVICYLLLYYKIDYKKFKLRWIIYIIILGIGVILVFWYIEMARSDSGFQNISLLSIVENMLDSLGGSDSVIAGIIIRADRFPQSGAVYLFDPIKRAIIDNPVMRIIINLFTGQTTVSYAQGMDYLLHHDSFADWFSYISSPSLYLSGSGSGSSYIAESYFAFGFLGVFVVSGVLGIIIAKITAVDLSSGKVYTNALSLFFLSQLFMLPRGATFGFATPLLYFVFVILVCIIFENLIVDSIRAKSETHSRIRC